MKRALTITAVLAALWLSDLACHRLLDPYVFLLLVLIGINVVLAVSLNLINGFTGQFSLGHAGFMAVGAYTAASLTIFFHTRMPSLAHSAFALPVLFMGALIAGGLMAAAAGLAVGLPTLRLRGDYLAIATLGFGEIIRVIFVNMEAVGGPRGLTDIPNFAELRTPGDVVVLTKLFWVALWAVLTAWIIRNLVRSTRGKAFLCIRDDETAAEAVGINTTRHKVLAFVIGAFFAGVAGGLFAHHQRYINPDDFKFMKSVEVVVMVILGGMGSLGGSLTGAISLTLLPEFLRVIGEYRLVIYALLLILLMLLRPQGILGGREVSLAGLRLKLAQRRSMG